jgi:hypothetical protein
MDILKSPALTFRIFALLGMNIISQAPSVTAEDIPVVAEATVAVWEQWFDANQTRPSSTEQRPEFMQHQAAVIVTPAIIYPVISNLHLQATWSTNGDPIRLEQAYERIVSHTRVTRYRDTALLSIQVAAFDPTLATEIANGIATTFVDSRHTAVSEYFRHKLQGLTETLAEYEAEVIQAESRLREIQNQLGLKIEDDNFTNLNQDARAILDNALLNCNTQRYALVTIRTQYELTKIQSQMPRVPAKIIKPAGSQ